MRSGGMRHGSDRRAALPRFVSRLQLLHHRREHLFHADGRGGARVIAALVKIIRQQWGHNFLLYAFFAPLRSIATEIKSSVSGL